MFCVCVCIRERKILRYWCVVKQTYKAASILPWETVTASWVRACLKLSSSYCSKGTVWLLVSHVWALLCVCVWYFPLGIPFLYPTDFRAALKFLLRGEVKGREEREKEQGGRERTTAWEHWKCFIFIPSLCFLTLVLWERCHSMETNCGCLTEVNLTGVWLYGNTGDTRTELCDKPAAC